MGKTAFEHVAKEFHERFCRRGEYDHQHPVYRTAGPWDQQTYDHKKRDLELIASVIDDHRRYQREHGVDVVVHNQHLRHTDYNDVVHYLHNHPHRR